MGADQDVLVDELERAAVLATPALEAAFRAVPRHRLLEVFYVRDPDSDEIRRVDHDPTDPDPAHLARIYSDAALVTRMEDGWPTSSTSQPSLMARMLELLDLAPGMRVLEIGTGTGYNAALLAEVVGDQQRVVSVDVDGDVIAQTRRLLAAAGYGDIELVCRDGFDGAVEHGPYDRIVATVACPDLSPRWADQLTAGGSMLIPLEHAGSHPLVRATHADGHLAGRVVGHSGFMPGRGGLTPLDWWQPRLHRPPDGRPNLHSSSEGPVHEEPVWDGFGRREPVTGSRYTADQLGLGLFVALSDRRAIWGGDEIGLTAGKAGWALATTDGIRWWGDESLREELHRLHERWTALGCPSTGAYRLTFTPRHCPSTDLPAPSWEIDRRHHREQAVLE